MLSDAIEADFIARDKRLSERVKHEALVTEDSLD